MKNLKRSTSVEERFYSHRMMKEIFSPFSNENSQDSPLLTHDTEYKNFTRSDFWKKIPAFAEVDSATFLSCKWQTQNTIAYPRQLKKILQDIVDKVFYQDFQEGLKKAPMAFRVTPYLVSLIDWNDPYNCPIRIQFLPVASQMQNDHPMLHLDTLCEQADSPVTGLVHRYHDRALFLALNICPVYCRFCTRSYAIGSDTESVKKLKINQNYKRWDMAFDYIRQHQEIEDIVISGGDCYMLKSDQIEYIGFELLKIPHIRRIRYATKGLSAMPQKFISDTEWTDALTHVVNYGKDIQKEVVVQTHFNHGSEITWITREAMKILFKRGITVRNQTVLQRNVNDNEREMTKLVKKLGHININPYYVYVCDMVSGVESLRTSVATAARIEKYVRGSTAGFNIPTFVCDAPNGGGKRGVHSYEYYNPTTGISVYTAPSVKPGKYFFYFDPLCDLPLEVQERWKNENDRRLMILNALRFAKG